MATNSPISKDNMYYTLIDGNVYMCRFKAVIVPINYLSERNLATEITDMTIDGAYTLKNGSNIPRVLKKSKMILFGRSNHRRLSHLAIKHIVLEIAGGIGECVWTSSSYNESKFNPLKIYHTIEDCINNVDPLFQWKPLDRSELIFTEECEYPIEDITPDNVNWKFTGYDVYGRIKYSPRTYRWNGIEAVEERVKVKDKHFGYNTPNYDMLFDLLRGKFLFDLDYLDDSYPSAEECKIHNHVKVFTF